MLDLHCHILPGLDDGPETLDEAVDMCRIAAADGITTIAATPHFRPGVYEHSSAFVRQQLELVAAELACRGIGVRLLAGAEVSVTPELARQFRDFDYLTINRTGKYFLAEFPPDFAPPRWDAFLLSFLRAGLA